MQGVQWEGTRTIQGKSLSFAAWDSVAIMRLPALRIDVRIAGRAACARSVREKREAIATAAPRLDEYVTRGDDGDLSQFSAGVRLPNTSVTPTRGSNRGNDVMDGSGRHFPRQLSLGYVSDCNLASTQKTTSELCRKDLELYNETTYRGSNDSSSYMFRLAHLFSLHSHFERKRLPRLQEYMPRNQL